MIKHLISQIPNTLTLFNLFLGCVSLNFIYQGNWEFAAFTVLLAALVDFFDGFVARMLKAQSVIGKDLDSLADCVTFGVVPGFVVFKQIQQLQPDSWFCFIAFLISMFSALRLARFNHDTRQSDCFYGLPTPANALLIIFLPLTLVHFTSLELLKSNILFWLSLSVFQSFLLVSPFKLLAFKFKDYSIQYNWPKYLIVLLSLPLLVNFSYFAIPFIIICYIVTSLIVNFFETK